MARSIHLSTARTMLNSLAKPKRFASKTMTGDPVDIGVWLSAFGRFRSVVEKEIRRL